MSILGLLSTSSVLSGHYYGPMIVANIVGKRITQIRDFLCCLRVLFLVPLISTSVLAGRLPWRRFPTPLRALNVPLTGSDLRVYSPEHELAAS